jgi:hypothetical protein
MTPVATPAHDQHEHDDDGYRRPATLTVDDTEYSVDVTLVGHFEPLDGRYHWYGRVAAHHELHAALEGRKRPARVATPDGVADGELSDVDPWGRYRLAGTSSPPFAVASAGDLEIAGAL